MKQMDPEDINVYSVTYDSKEIVFVHLLLSASSSYISVMMFWVSENIETFKLTLPAPLES